MAILIPVNNNTDRTITVSLGNEDYDIRTRWNTFDESWYMYVGLAARDPVVKVKLLGGIDLLRPYQHKDGIPEGVLTLVDTDSIYGRPTQQEFGFDKRYRLYLLEAEDFIVEE